MFQNVNYRPTVFKSGPRSLEDEFKTDLKMQRLIYWKMKFNCCIQKQKESATPTKHNTNFQKTIEINQKMFQNAEVAELSGQDKRMPLRRKHRWAAAPRCITGYLMAKTAK